MGAVLPVIANEVNMAAEGRKQGVLPARNWVGGRTSSTQDANRLNNDWRASIAASKEGLSTAVSLTQHLKKGKVDL